eukprot:9568376-Alexandrium_andersonii.AAC.1
MPSRERSSPVSGADQGRGANCRTSGGACGKCRGRPSPSTLYRGDQTLLALGRCRDTGHAQ